MTTLLVGLALGMRHGTDPDHLTAIDGLSRIRPRSTNGLYFALGHGLMVTLLAAGIGQIVFDRVAFLGSWMLIFIGAFNLLKLFRKSAQPWEKVKRPIIVQTRKTWKLRLPGTCETTITYRLKPSAAGTRITVCAEGFVG